jgi:hypothetical protein
MAKNFFAIIDTETTIDGLVADFACVICDQKGNVVKQMAVIVSDVYKKNDLFYDNKATGEFTKASLSRRYARYDNMIASGSRRLASVISINSWLKKAIALYNPILTAYNLPFDLEKSANTGIDLTEFKDSFCLWQAAFSIFAHKKAFRQMVIDTHAFNTPTAQGNMTFKTNAEVMARFVLGNPSLEDEPHTALEDVIFYELPILKAVFNKKSYRWLKANIRPYSWKETQVKDWFKAK